MQPARFQIPEWFASHCYIVVIQDIRGQGASDGVFYEYAHDRDDGYDSVEWAARLPSALAALAATIAIAWLARRFYTEDPWGNRIELLAQA